MPAKNVSKTNKANLGKHFEDLIIAANKHYAQKKIAAIIKVPTSFKVLRRYDPRQKQSVIVGCYPEERSTVDFIGQLGSLPIAFEAKSSANKTSFPLSNIKSHQIEWLRLVDALGGFAFIMFEIQQLRSIYRMDIKQLLQFTAENSRKSIPFSFFEEYCEKIRIEKGILHYLGGIGYEIASI